MHSAGAGDEAAENRGIGTPEDSSLRYAMLGDDVAGVVEKLEKYTGEVAWDYLKRSVEAGAVLFVDPSLSIVEVGQAFAEDDADAVARWKSSGDIIVPGTPHAAYWDQINAKFVAVAVSPFVLIQPVLER